MSEFSLEEIKEQFCMWHCTKKETSMECGDEVELYINGSEVFSDSPDKTLIKLCEYCPIDDFVYFIRR